MTDVKGGLTGASAAGPGTCSCRCGEMWAEMLAKLIGMDSPSSCGCACTSATINELYQGAALWHQ